MKMTQKEAKAAWDKFVVEVKLYDNPVCRCLNSDGNVDYTHGSYKCPICGGEVETYYPFYNRVANLQYCGHCDKYFRMG